MRPRYAALILFFLPCACEGRSQRLSSAGPKAVFAAEQADSATVRARRVWDGGGADGMSPDGRQVAYTEWDSGNVVIRDLQSGSVKNVTRNVKPYSPGFGMTPRISRDGRWVAYSWSREGTFGAQLRVASVDGSEPRIIYDVGTQTSVQAQDWSPDGRTILAVRSQEDGTKQIVLVPTAGGAVRTLRSLDWREPMRMSFSPDGRFIAYDFPTVDESNVHRDVFVLDLASGRESRLVEHAANDYLLGWGPDADHVLFASDRAGTPSAWLQTVRDGRPIGAPVLVKSELWNVAEGQFASDGAFFYGVQTASRQANLATLDAGTGKVTGGPVSITPAPNGRVNDPQWSPDGRSVSYLIGNNGRTESITIRSVESGMAREIPTPHALVYSYHRWFRDGKSILLSGSPKGNGGFFRLDVRTAKAMPLFMLERGAVVPGFRAFELAPDDRTMVYQKVSRPVNGGSRHELIVRDFETQRERVLLAREGPGIGLWMAVSPDATQLAFVDGYDKDAQLKIVPLSGGAPRRIGGDFIPQGNSPLAWTTDGRALYVVRGSGRAGDLTGSIWRVPVAGAAADSTGIVAEQITELRLDPTGRRLVYASGSTKAELWVMDRFPTSGSRTARAER